MEEGGDGERGGEEGEDGEEVQYPPGRLFAREVLSRSTQEDLAIDSTARTRKDPRKTYRVATVAPKSLRNEPSGQFTLFPHAQFPTARFRFLLEMLVVLLLVVRQHFETNDENEETGDGVIGETDSGDLVRWREDGGQSEQHVDGELSGHQEEILDKGDEEEVH